MDGHREKAQRRTMKREHGRNECLIHTHKPRPVNERYTEDAFNLMEVFRTNLRHYRLMNKMTQKEIGSRTGLPPSLIGEIERGVRNITMESASKICRGLEIPVSRMFAMPSSCYVNDEARQEASKEDQLFEDMARDVVKVIHRYSMMKGKED